MANSTIEIRQNVARHYYFVLSTPTFEGVFKSPAYRTYDGALAAINALRSSAGFNNRYELLMSPRKELYFAVRGHDNQILGTSVMFISEESREKAIQSLKRYAPNAQLIAPA